MNIKRYDRIIVLSFLALLLSLTIMLGKTLFCNHFKFNITVANYVSITVEFDNDGHQGEE